MIFGLNKDIQLHKLNHSTLWCDAWHVSVNQSNALGRLFASRLCHSRQTHIGSGAAQWLPWGPSNIPRQIPEMAIKRNFTLPSSKAKYQIRYAGSSRNKVLIKTKETTLFDKFGLSITFKQANLLNVVKIFHILFLFQVHKC